MIKALVTGGNRRIGRAIAADQALAGAKINAMCPGWVRTCMAGHGVTRSPEGGDAATRLTTLPDDGPTGGFFRDRRRIEW